jgi:hypothetical protein
MDKATTERRKVATAQFMLRVIAQEQKHGIIRPDAEAFRARMTKQANRQEG